MPTKYQIQVENSAPSQHRSARSVHWAAPILHGLGARSAVDLGCGRLRNLPILTRYFDEIVLVDTELQCQRIAGSVPSSRRFRLLTVAAFKSDTRVYDTVFLISVLHIIPGKKTRIRLLELATSKLHNPGYLVIDVPVGERYYRQQCSESNRYKDGWVMGVGPLYTFYKNYSSKELDDFIQSCTGFELHSKISIDKHLARIWCNGS